MSDKFCDTKIRFIFNQEQLQKMVHFYVKANGQVVPDAEDLKIEIDLGDEVKEFEKGYSYNATNNHSLIVTFDIDDMNKDVKDKDEAWTSDPIVVTSKPLPCGKEECPADDQAA